MTISPLAPKTRKFVLTVHVISSVGWLGTALVILVLVTAALVTAAPELRRAAYLVLDLLDSTIVVPVGLAGLISGVLLSLTTHWGLVRHYWVVVKLVLTVVVFAVPLFARSPVIDEAVARTAVPGADAGPAGTELLIPGVMALLILAAATVLSTYKPWGRTPVGRRVAAERVRAARSR
jgi:hypothetical protein